MPAATLKSKPQAEATQHQVQQKTLLSLPELRDYMVKWFPDALKRHAVGTHSVGILRREGRQIMPIYWPEFYADFIADNPQIGNSMRDTIEAGDYLIDTELRQSVDTREQRHNFSSRDQWNEHRESRLAGSGLTPPWARCAHCTFYPMEAWNVVPSDFVFFRKEKTVKPPKAFKPIALRQGPARKPVVYIPINIGDSMLTALAKKYPTLSACTVATLLIQKIDGSGGWDVPVKLEGVMPKEAGDAQRDNITISLEIDDKIRHFANHNETSVANIVRTVLADHPHWQSYTKDVTFI